MTNPEIKDGPLERYMSILEAIAPFPEGLTAADLESALELPKTTVNRLLRVLLEASMITVSHSRTRSYKLGERVLRLLHSSPDTVWVETLARRPLQVLVEQTGQSAFISKFDGSQVSSITCVAPDTPVRMYVVPGMSMPWNATATGKAILAFQHEAVVEEILSQPLPNFTESTTTDVGSLRTELATIHNRGYATELGEHVAGLATIAYPIFTPPSRVTYAVGLTGARSCIIDQSFSSNCQALAEAATRLGKLLQLPLDRADA